MQLLEGLSGFWNKRQKRDILLKKESSVTINLSIETLMKENWLVVLWINEFDYEKWSKVEHFLNLLDHSNYTTKYSR